MMAYGRFEYPGFTVDAFGRSRIKQFVEDAIADKRLYRGVYRPRAWVGVMALSRLCRSFIVHCAEYGAINWDYIVARLLSVTLVASLGARAGDVALSKGYAANECLQYRHIRLALGEGPASVDGLEADITLEFVKGHKWEAGAAVLKHVSASRDPETFHISPIHWLLAHAIRHGLVEGGAKTVREVLDAAAARHDRCIRWTHPEWPVLAAFVPGRAHLCRLDQPARAGQVDDALKRMGLVAGMLGRVYSHSLRAGAAREAAHLPSSSAIGQGVATEAVRQAMGHTTKAFAAGVTETYTGGASGDVYAARIANRDARHRREPDFATAPAAIHDAVRAPATDEEIATEARRRAAAAGGSSASSKGGAAAVKSSLTRAVRSGREATAKAAAAAEPRFVAMRDREHAPSPLAPTPRGGETGPLREVSGNVPRNPATAKDETPTWAATGTKKKRRAGAEGGDGGDQVLPAVVEHPADSADDAGSGVGGKVAVDLANIDPRLLDEDSLASLELCEGDAAVARLSQTVRGMDAGPQELERVDEEQSLSAPDEEAERLLLSQPPPSAPAAATPTDPTATSPNNAPPAREEQQHHLITSEAFVDSYARCNVVKNEIFAKAWGKWTAGKITLADVHATGTAPTGGARDPPTPFHYRCRATEGCTFTHHHQGTTLTHEKACSPAQVAAAAEDREALACPRPGCDYSTKSRDPQKSLKAHISGVHDFVPQRCGDCGDESSRVFTSRNALQAHKEKEHRGRWPARCAFPACESEELFSANSMRKHLKVAHAVTEDYNAYYPPMPTRTRFLRSSACQVDGCTIFSSIRTEHELMKHLERSHGMDQAARDDYLNAHSASHFETYVPKPKDETEKAARTPSTRAPKRRAAALAAAVATLND